MSLIVSDSSVLIHLGAVGRLMLLKSLYGRVIVPPAVDIEIIEQGSNRPSVASYRAAVSDGWIEKQMPFDQALITLLQQQLDWGEAQAIALAIEQNATLILIDDAHARDIADLYQLPKIGTLGILLQAKQHGLITSIKEELKTLRTHMWLSDQLVAKVLAAANEA